LFWTTVVKFDDEFGFINHSLQQFYSNDSLTVSVSPAGWALCVMGNKSFKTHCFGCLPMLPFCSNKMRADTFWITCNFFWCCRLLFQGNNGRSHKGKPNFFLSDTPNEGKKTGDGLNVQGNAVELLTTCSWVPWFHGCQCRQPNKHSTTAEQCHFFKKQAEINVFWTLQAGVSLSDCVELCSVNGQSMRTQTDCLRTICFALKGTQKSSSMAGFCENELLTCKPKDSDAIEVHNEEHPNSGNQRWTKTETDEVKIRNALAVEGRGTQVQKDACWSCCSPFEHVVQCIVHHVSRCDIAEWAAMADHWGTSIGVHVSKWLIKRVDGSCVWDVALCNIWIVQHGRQGKHPKSCGPQTKRRSTIRSVRSVMCACFTDLAIAPLHSSQQVCFGAGANDKLSWQCVLPVLKEDRMNATAISCPFFAIVERNKSNTHQSVFPGHLFSFLQLHGAQWAQRCCHQDFLHIAKWPFERPFFPGQQLLLLATSS